jgi:hypothetical protein
VVNRLYLLYAIGQNDQFHHLIVIIYFAVFLTSNSSLLVTELMSAGAALRWCNRYDCIEPRARYRCEGPVQCNIIGPPG